jgi:hypothetical protein
VASGQKVFGEKGLEGKQTDRTSPALHLPLL